MFLSAGRVWTRNPVPAPPVGACIVDASIRHQQIDGFGSTLWAPPAYPTAFNGDNITGWLSVLDFLYTDSTSLGNGIGINQSIHNFPITDAGSANGAPLYSSGAINSTAMLQEEIGDWSVEKAIVSRGVKRICARCWGPSRDPGGPYTYQVGGAINGALLADHYAAFASVMTTLFDNGVANGVYITDLATQNEPDFAQNGQEQIAWTTAQSLTFLKSNLYPAFTTWIATANGQKWQSATGLSRPRILWGETEQWSVAASTWIPAVEGDSTALGEVDIYTTHQYGSGQGASAPPSPCSHPIWQTEVFDQAVASYDTSMTTAMNSMSMLYAGLTTGNAQAYLHWNGEDLIDGDNEGLVGANATATVANWVTPTIPKRAYCFGQFSKFVRPFSTRIDVSNAPAGVKILAFRLPGNAGYVAIVCINTNTSSTAITIYVNNVECLQVTPWITDASNSLSVQSPIPLVQQAFSATLGATSVTTFVY